jgi:predicted nucleic acid-binding Zn ribbon protein
MRRPGPRSIGGVLAETLRQAAPGDLLSRAQTVWPTAVGAVIAAESAPVSEREGTVTVGCASAAWAQELELMAGDLIGPLNAALGDVRVRRLRFITERSATAP